MSQENAEPGTPLSVQFSLTDEDHLFLLAALANHANRKAKDGRAPIGGVIFFGAVAIGLVFSVSMAIFSISKGVVGSAVAMAFFTVFLASIAYGAAQERISPGTRLRKRARKLMKQGSIESIAGDYDLLIDLEHVTQVFHKRDELWRIPSARVEDVLDLDDWIVLMTDGQPRVHFPAHTVDAPDPVARVWRALRTHPPVAPPPLTRPPGGPGG